MKRPTPMDELMRALENERDLSLPMDPAYFDGLHERIMNAVEQKKIQKRPLLERPRRLLQAHWRGWLASTVSLMSLVLAAQLTTRPIGQAIENSHAVVAARNEDQILELALQTPESISETVLVSQSSGEFLADVAQRSFDDLSAEKFNHLMSKDVN